MPFDQAKADRVKQFIRARCTHTKGEWAGQPFNLVGWQDEAVDKIFGTVREDGTRQYRFVYIEIPKKNGKTEFAGALALYLLCGDDEKGGEVYMAASDSEQATLCFSAADTMRSNDTKLSKQLYSIRRRIMHPASNSFLQVLSHEAYTKHGLNPHGIICDEIHSWPNRELWDVLTSGSDFARKQQLVIIITTAGIFDPHCIWWELRNHAIKVRDGVIDDPSFLPILYIADAHKDDPEDEKLWERVNPSVGHIFTMDKIRDEYKRVRDNASEWSNFKRFRLNIPANAESQWIDNDIWRACGGGDYPGDERLTGLPCYSGLDLSSTTDLSALVHVFGPDKDSMYDVLCRFFMPKDNIMKRVKSDRVPYDQWVDAGWVTATPGATVNHEVIVQQFMNDGKLFDIREVAFDRWGSVYILNRLEELGFIDESEAKAFTQRVMISFGQGYKSMSPAVKELQGAIISKRIRHYNNPVLAWNMSNVYVDIDPAEGMKFNKKKSTDRIDGAVALAMGYYRAFVRNAEPKIEPRIVGV